MEQKVLVFAGAMQSGKSTSAKFITGYRMKQAGDLRSFDIDKDGDLIVSSSTVDENGKVQEVPGVLDIYRTDTEFAKYAYYKIWPHAKVYSFATELKNSAINIFGLNPKNIYGTNEDKSKPTHIKWSDIWGILSEERREEISKKYNTADKDTPPKICLTHREVLQDFGTICRMFDADCWVKACWNKIEYEGFPYCIIDDCRYENEVLVSQKKNAYLVYLTRRPFKNDKHNSERIHLVNRSLFNYTLDNEKLTLTEKNSHLVKILDKAGWSTLEIT